MRNELKKIGLNENEIKVYLTLLSVGCATVSVLSYRCEMSRNTCRYVCSQLVEKKLIFSKREGNTFVFKPEPPEKLYYLIEQEEKKIERRKEGLDRVMGELKAMSDPESLMPKVKLYQGENGIKTSYIDMVNQCESKEIFAIFSVEEEVGVNLQQFFVNEYVPERVKKNIYMKNICLKSPKGLRYKKNDKRDLRETKVVSSEHFPIINTEINLFDDTMHYMSFDKQESFAMIVKDKYITSMLKAVFRLMWDTNPHLKS